MEKNSKGRTTFRSTTDIIRGLNKKANEDIDDKVKEIHVETEKKLTRHEAFKELASILESELKDREINSYIEPIVDRGDIFIIEYKDHSFEIKG